MAFLTYRIVFLAILMVGFTPFGSALRVVTTPQPYNFLTEELNVSCVADEPEYLVKSILSIQIMRHVEDKPIALVNVKQQLKMAVGIKSNLKAEGHIGTNSNNSYLTLIIDKPVREEAVGTYRCQIFFIDENFQMVEENVIGNVTYQEQDIVEVVKDLSRKMTGLMSKVIEQKNADIEMTKEMDRLKKDNTNKQQKLDELIDYVSQQNKTIREHESLLQNMAHTLSFLSEGWTYYRKDKTLIKIFGQHDTSQHLTWFMAREACQGFGGDLVQIRDAEKNNFVYRMFDGGRKYSPWIGTQNIAVNGYDFKFVDGSDLGDYHPWYKEDPNGNGNYDVKCVAQYTDTNDPGEWFDDKCSKRRSYVCSTRTLTAL